MKRSEFLKRLGLGAVAAVTVPSLLKGEEKAEVYRKSSDKVKSGEQIAFWRKDNGGVIPCSSPTFLATACYTLEIPPLEPGKYKYELTIDGDPTMSGNIKAK